MTGNGRAGRAARWMGLAAASLAVALALDFIRLPAAFLLGPLVVGIVARLSGSDLVVPRPAVYASQALIGAMIGAALTPSIVTAFLADWPILTAVVAATVVFATASGWLLSWFGVVPGTTGVWGSSPGAATAMVILSEAHGGDVRLVAFMQYLRVLFVASAASIGARLWLGAGAVAHRDLLAAVDPQGLAVTLAVVAVTAAIGHFSRLANGVMMGPIVALAVLHGSGLLTPVLPPWLLIVGYAGLGWNIGLRFTPEAIAHAARALPWIVLSIVVLMAFAAGLAWLLVLELGIDPLTAFLATSPGGMDTVAIIAASTPVDVGFVMALQVLRFFVLVMIGPSLSRFVAARLSQR
ncbi:AbrB family transcriptional regulator [Pinisolibacter sp.]|uniref:AbrB family transcriptional regulator n=1 Tax=Pinisolibacter sp. TaxID=2172024 RepID=UPI002FDCF7F0